MEKRMYVLIFLTIFATSIVSQQDIEIAYLKLAKKMVRFEITGYENLDNLDSKGECCAGVGLNICTPCSSRMSYHRTEKNGDVKVFDIGYFSNNSNSTFYSTKIFNSNPEQHISFKIIHTEYLGGAHLDTWDNFSTSWVGSYIMNGVWGIFGNTLLYYSVDVLPLSSYGSYYSVTFRIFRVQWLKKEYLDGSCCQSIAATTCINSCPFQIKVSSNDSPAFYSSPSAYNGNQTSYFVKAATGTTSPLLQQDNLKLSLSVVGYSSGKIIDEMVINNIRAFPNKDYEFNGLSGTYGKLKIDIHIKFECRGYNGYNCRHFCSENTRNVDCNFYTGNKFCSNGASDLPTCLTFNDTCNPSQCINDGICSPLPSGFNCICPKGYKGKYCEKHSCESECQRGNCVNNKCVCDPNFEGDNCDITNCPSGSVINCLNGGLCKMINKNPTCVCLNFTSGYLCEMPVCENNCKIGKCAFIENSKPIRTQCVCLYGFTGDTCNKSPLKLTNKTYNFEIVIITLFAILFALSFKLFLITIFIKLDGQVKYEKISNTEAENDEEDINEEKENYTALVGL